MCNIVEEERTERVKLTIIRGLPGSGKSTYAKNHYNCLILENDMFHMQDGKYMWDKDHMPQAIDWCMETCANALSLGMDVVVSNTFTKRSSITKYIELADMYGADWEVIRCTGKYENVHSVPKYVLESMESRFEDWSGEKIV